MALYAVTFGIGAGAGAAGTLWAAGGIANAMRDKPGTILFAAGSASLALQRLYRKATEQRRLNKMQEPDLFERKVAMLCHPGTTDVTVGEILRGDPMFKTNLEGNHDEAKADVALHEKTLRAHPNSSYYTKELKNARRDRDLYGKALERITEFEGRSLVTGNSGKRVA